MKRDVCHTQLGSGCCEVALASLHPRAGGFGDSSWRLLGDLLWVCQAVLVTEASVGLCEHWGSTGGAQPRALSLWLLFSPQQSALIVQGPQEVKKRELVFLQFRLNQSSEDFSAIDYLLFSSFQEFMQRWLSHVHRARLLPCTSY